MSTHPPKRRTAESTRIIARMRALCLALPGVSEKVSWAEPTWRVAGRVFAQMADHHHGDRHVAVWLAMPAGAQLALLEAEPARFFYPPYVGHRGWIGVILDGEPNWDMVAAVTAQAHEAIASSSVAPVRRARRGGAKIDDRGAAPRSRPKAPARTAGPSVPAASPPRTAGGAAPSRAEVTAPPGDARPARARSSRAAAPPRTVTARRSRASLPPTSSKRRST